MEKSHDGGGEKMMPKTMMTLAQHSLLMLLFVLPLGATAGSKTWIPTSIQVVDAQGRTVMSTHTPPVIKEPPRAPFLVPDICLPLMHTEPADTDITSIIQGHPLATRIESQYATLRLLVERLSFAPHLSQQDEHSFKMHFLRFENGTPSSTHDLDCLFLLSEEFRARGGKVEEGLIQHLHDVRQGLEYGIRHSSAGEIDIPTNTEAALFAGDLLLSRCDTCTSISIREKTAEIVFLLPVRILGRWERSARVHILFDDTGTSFSAPWWIVLVTHDLQKVEGASGNTRREDTVAGMFLRIKETVALISP